MSFLLNGIRWFNGVFTGTLNWNPTANHVIALPPLSGVVALEDQPVGVGGAGVSLRGYEPIVPATTSKILGLADSGTVQIFTNSAAAIVTIPLNSSVAFPIGTRIIVRKSTTFTVTLAWAVGVSVISELGTTLVLTDIANDVILRKTGTDTWSCRHSIPFSANLPGDPTCGTQSVGSNNNRIATTAFIRSTLISSPVLTGTTLAGATVVNGTSFASSVPSSFTGATTVPTAALGDVSLQAANTTFVARSRRPIVIATRVTALTLTQTYTDFAFDNKMRDSSNAYNATTGVFTASYAGIYAFSVYVSNFQAVSGWTLVGLSAVANTELTRIAIAPGPALHATSGRQLVFLNAGDTRRYGVQVGGANAGATVEASLTTQVACYMSIEYLGIDT